MLYGQREPGLLRFVSFLSPNLYPFYAALSRYLGERTERYVELMVGHAPEKLTHGEIDVAFMCGLPTIQLIRQSGSPIELLAAPVLSPSRYEGRAVYYSDLITRRESPMRRFEDLRGCTWGYNEQSSHSGWNVVCAHLEERGLSPSYFGSLVKTGSHLRSLEMLLSGEIDAAAIDSHVLDVYRLQHPEHEERLRVVAALGPSSIPPIVVSRHLSPALKSWLRYLLLEMHHDPRAEAILRRGLVERFVAVSAEDYQPIYKTFARVQQRCTMAAS